MNRHVRLAAAVGLALWIGLAEGQTVNERALVMIQGADLKPPFDFVVIGDPQGRYDATARLLAGADRLDPAFIIFMGDLTPGGQEEDYQKYTACIGAVKRPVVSIIGNHDVRAPGGRAAYERIFGKTDFRFDVGGRRFVALDTSGPELDAAQLTWLAGALDGRQRTYVFTHRPPYMGNWWFDSFVGGTGRFLSLTGQGRVPRVFLGHLHVLDGMEWKGTRFLVVGSGGIIPYSLPQGKVARCFVRVHVTQDGEEIEAYGLQGERIEIPSGFFD